MKKEFIIFNLMTKQYFCGFFTNHEDWSEFLYNADLITDILDAERIIKNQDDGFYQIIEVYKPL